MRKFIVGGNFKCNGDLESIKEIIENLNNTKINENNDVFIAPSFVHLYYIKTLLKNSNIKLAAQNCSLNDNGAFTGEVSINMLKDIGVEYVILGHSDRRKIGESDQLIAKKVKKVLKNNLKVIFCIGENLEEKQNGKTLDVLKKQINYVKNENINNFNNIIIAYEPIWSIGTGLVASPNEINEILYKIRIYLAQLNINIDKVRIQYGGSVNGSNCHSLSRIEHVDGFLIGGASLRPEFVECINV